MTQSHENETIVATKKDGSPAKSPAEAQIIEVFSPDGESTLIVPADSKGDPFGPVPKNQTQRV